LPKLVALRLEFDVEGPELICALADKYALNAEISLWRGNKALITDNPESAWNAYNRDFPLKQPEEVKMNCQLN
jgi:hypothetical protein